MSLLFCDSFDGVVAAERKWDIWNGNNQVGTEYGRNGTKGLLMPRTSGTRTNSKLISPATNRVYAGVWVYADDSTNNDNHAVLRLAAGSDMFGVGFGAAGTNRFAVEGTGVPVQTVGPTGIGQRHTWVFLEIMWEPGVAAEVRANGQSIFTGTPGGSGTPDAVQFVSTAGLTAGGIRRFYDDLYVVDSSGSTNNTFLGPVKIANLKPDGEGNRTELTPTPPGNNWERVSDGDDETYVEGDAGDGDLYTFDDLPSSNDVLGVVQYFLAFDSEGGAITGRAITRVDGTEYDGEDNVMPGSVAAHIQPWDVNPDTGQPWTPAEINAAEFGMEFDT